MDGRKIAKAAGSVLRENRLTAGYSQRYIARLCDRDPSQISRFERTGVGSPDMLLAYFLAMPERVEYIFEDFLEVLKYER